MFLHKYCSTWQKSAKLYGNFPRIETRVERHSEPNCPTNKDLNSSRLRSKSSTVVCKLYKLSEWGSLTTKSLILFLDVDVSVYQQREANFDQPRRFSKALFLQEGYETMIFLLVSKSLEST